MSYTEKHGAHSKARNTPNFKVIIAVIVLMVAVAAGVIVTFSTVRGSARNDAPAETVVDKHKTDKTANSTEGATDSKKAEAAVDGESSASGSNGSNAKSSDGSASSQKADRGGGKDDGSADNVVDANGSSDADSNNGQGGNDNSGGDSGNSSSNEGMWTGYY